MYGASSIWALQNGQPGSAFATRQLIGVVAGTGLLLIGSKIDYHLWRRYAWGVLGGTALLLLVPLLPVPQSVAPEINGARRWVDLWVVRVQPSEFAKFAVVAWVAMLAAKKGSGVREFRTGLLPFLVILVPFTALVLFEPDLSAATVLALLAAIVLFAAGAKIGHFLLLGVAAIPVAWYEIASVQYRLARMITFLSPGTDLAESSWQIQQSLIGIGAGQLFGVGFGEGLQKLGYLPYAYSDFIFSTIGEEWGFLGVTLIVLLLALYVWLGFRIARTAMDAFGRLLATGLTSLIAVGALLHIAVTMALIPATGVNLPFVSYGRSSLMTSLFTTGVLISVAHGRQRARSKR